MIHEIRTYDINPERWEEFLDAFENLVLPLYQSLGEIARGCWVDSKNHKFIWIRAFRDNAHRADTNAAVARSDAWAKYRELSQGTLVTNRVVVETEPAVFSPLK